MTAGRKCECHNGKVTGIGCGPTIGCKTVELTCGRCEGFGWIDPVRDEALQAGETLRAKRQCIDLSIREAARSLGMGAAEYSDLEFAKYGATAERIRDVMALLVQHHKELIR